jgi:hypothetical protein
MRCPHCELPNDDETAYCISCGTPLTAYGGQVQGTVSAETLAKARELAVRPQAVPVIAALDALVALFWAFGGAIRAFTARPDLAADNLNYVGHAFGAVNVALVAGFLVPAGVALLVVAWGVLTQRSWAWTANAGILGLTALWTLIRFGSAPFLSFVKLAACGAAAWAWMQPRVRSWYGTG